MTPDFDDLVAARDALLAAEDAILRAEAGVDAQGERERFIFHVVLAAGFLSKIRQRIAVGGSAGRAMNAEAHRASSDGESDP